jgi:DNA-binding transcriptional regulator GbsR (MarR family)
MDDCIAGLNLSRGSACQGLRFLRSVGAIEVVYVAGDRRLHYEAVAELRNLVIRFVREQVLPHLDSGQERLARMAGLVKQLPADERAHVSGRVKLLQSWEKNVRRFLPLVVKILGR